MWCSRCAITTAASRRPCEMPKPAACRCMCCAPTRPTTSNRSCSTFRISTRRRCPARRRTPCERPRTRSSRCSRPLRQWSYRLRAHISAACNTSSRNSTTSPRGVPAKSPTGACVSPKPIELTLFITFEGTEGSGKSLQARLQASTLRQQGVSVLETHEPGGTPLGDEVRQLLLARDELTPVARAEALLMNASRAQLVERVIVPALQGGTVVVCDRFADSTRAYQGAGRG